MHYSDPRGVFQKKIHHISTEDNPTKAVEVIPKIKSGGNACFQHSKSVTKPTSFESSFLIKYYIREAT